MPVLIRGMPASDLLWRRSHPSRSTKILHFSFHSWVVPIRTCKILDTLESLLSTTVGEHVTTLDRRRNTLALCPAVPSRLKMTELARIPQGLTAAILSFIIERRQRLNCPGDTTTLLARED